MNDNKLEHSMSAAILNQYKVEAYERGIRAALSELREVYGEGLEATNIWADYMKPRLTNAATRADPNRLLARRIYCPANSCGPVYYRGN
jgi:hypothetical protein